MYRLNEQKRARNAAAQAGTPGTGGFDAHIPIWKSH